MSMRATRLELLLPRAPSVPETHAGRTRARSLPQLQAQLPLVPRRPFRTRSEGALGQPGKQDPALAWDSYVAELDMENYAHQQWRLERSGRRFRQWTEYAAKLKSLHINRKAEIKKATFRVVNKRCDDDDDPKAPTTKRAKVGTGEPDCDCGLS